MREIKHSAGTCLNHDGNIGGTVAALIIFSRSAEMMAALRVPGAGSERKVVGLDRPHRGAEAKARWLYFERSKSAVVTIFFG